MNTPIMSLTKKFLDIVMLSIFQIPSFIFLNGKAIVNTITRIKLTLWKIKLYIYILYLNRYVIVN